MQSHCRKAVQQHFDFALQPHAGPSAALNLGQRGAQLIFVRLQRSNRLQQSVETVIDRRQPGAGGRSRFYTRFLPSRHAVAPHDWMQRKLCKNPDA
jgi:hypothetical protein